MRQRIMFAIGLCLLAALLAVRLASPVVETARSPGGAGLPPVGAGGKRLVVGERREPPGAVAAAVALPPEPERRLNALPLPQMIRARLADLIEPPAPEQPILKREMLAAAAVADATTPMRTGKGPGGGGRRRPEAGAAEPEKEVEEEVDPHLRLWRRFSENVLGELELTLLLQDSGAVLSGGAVVLRQQLPPGWEIVAVRPEPQVRQPQQLKWLLVPAEPTRELLVQMVLRPSDPGPSAAVMADRASWPSAFRCRPATGEVIAGVGCDLP